MSERLIVMRPVDNVATLLAPGARGEVLAPPSPPGPAELVLRADIPFGHKVALRSIPRGADVIKYGEIIGVASSDIRPGEHVHVHNVASRRARGDRV